MNFKIHTYGARFIVPSLTSLGGDKKYYSCSILGDKSLDLERQPNHQMKVRGCPEKFIGWLWCNGQNWPNGVCFLFSPAVHTLLPSVLQHLEFCGIETFILILKKVLHCRYDLFIGLILLPSQVFFSCWGTEYRWCQIRRIRRVIKQFKAIN